MKAILFDLDGTLTDPREGITRSIAYALERMGLACPPLDNLCFAIGPPLWSAPWPSTAIASTYAGTTRA